MSQIFNANPTIFSAPSHQTDTKKYEWLDINALDEVKESGEVEPIDRDEIFGTYTDLLFAFSWLNMSIL
jgi:hypothetical protein